MNCDVMDTFAKDVNDDKDGMINKCWRNLPVEFSPECFRPESGVWKLSNPLPVDKIVDWSKLKQMADDILKQF